MKKLRYKESMRNEDFDNKISKYKKKKKEIKTEPSVNNYYIATKNHS